MWIFLIQMCLLLCLFGLSPACFAAQEQAKLAVETSAQENDKYHLRAFVSGTMFDDYSLLGKYRLDLLNAKWLLVRPDGLVLPLQNLGYPTSMLMSIVELRRKLHLKGDSVANRFTQNNVKFTSWFDHGQVMGNSKINCLVPNIGFNHTLGSKVTDYGLPVIGSLRGAKRLSPCDIPLPQLWDEPYKKQWPPSIEAGESKYDLERTIKKDEQ